MFSFTEEKRKDLIKYYEKKNPYTNRKFQKALRLGNKSNWSMTLRELPDNITRLFILYFLNKISFFLDCSFIYS